MLSPALLLSAALTLAPTTGLLASSRGDDSLGLREGRRFRPSARPSRARLVSGPDWKLLGGGIGLFASGYLTSVALGALVGRDPLFVIPIAGPFIHLATLLSRTGAISEPSLLYRSPLLVIYSAALVILGGAQLVGAILIVAGAAQQRPMRVRGVQVALSPGAGGAPLGASVVGRF